MLAPGGRPGLPSLYCRGCVRGERLHSVYIIKARRRHTHTHTEAFRYRDCLYLASFLSVTLSNTQRHSDTLTYTSFNCCSSYNIKLSLCLVLNKIRTRCNEEFRKRKCFQCSCVFYIILRKPAWAMKLNHHNI